MTANIANAVSCPKLFLNIRASFGGGDCFFACPPIEKLYLMKPLRAKQSSALPDIEGE